LLQAGEADTPCTQLQPDHADTPLQAPVVYNAAFERDWNIGSFSKLARDLSQATPTSALSPLQILRPADDETPTLAQAASPALQTASPNHAVSWHQFTRGAQAGNFLHDQLEWLATERFALSSNAPLVARLTKRCERAGYGAHTETVVQWLTQVTQTRLPGPQVALADLTTVLPEMEFWLATEHMQAQDIDAQCCAHLLPGLDRPSLAERQLHGMLMGFADLVFEHQGKFWVLDYKSNHLGDQDADYTPDTLAQAMAAHRYDVQAAIYMLALHRLLKMRLGTQYQPEQHLGGAIYLFLRGINGPRQGVCLLPAPAPLLKALDAMLQQETPVL
jgi:exodeoxyribonuclease V beta subunit